MCEPTNSVCDSDATDRGEAGARVSGVPHQSHDRLQMARARRGRPLGRRLGGPIATASWQSASDRRGHDQAGHRPCGKSTGGAARSSRVLLAAEGIAIAPRTVDRIIEREGLTRLDTAPAPALTRFERPAANDLWQMDAKGHYPLRPQGRCHPLSILDDHSRYAVGLAALPALETGGVQRTLTACFERYGLPTAMLMDHGVPWWSATNEGGLTTLSVFLLKQGIRLLYGRGSPSANAGQGRALSSHPRRTVAVVGRAHRPGRVRRRLCDVPRRVQRPAPP